MKKAVLMLFVLILVTNAYADRFPGPYPYVAVSQTGQYYFKMIPPIFGEGVINESRRNGWGVAYRLNPDGSSDELWGTEGWYSNDVYISEDACHLVRLERLIQIGNKMKGDLAIAFYENGRLLCQYTVADLVKDHTKIVETVSFYRWIASDVQDLTKILTSERGDSKVSRPTLHLNNMFSLVTCDGILYIFDVANGKIKSQKVL